MAPSSLPGTASGLAPRRRRQRESIDRQDALAPGRFAPSTLACRKLGGCQLRWHVIACPLGPDPR